MGQSIQEWTKWNVWNTAFKKFEVIWPALKFCLPQISRDPFLNTLSHMVSSDYNFKLLVKLIIPGSYGNHLINIYMKTE